jgi:hypothetical protein
LYFFRTSKINVNGILIEYEGEDSGIGLLFASKAAVQVPYPPRGNPAPDNCVIPPPIRKFVLFWCMITSEENVKMLFKSNNVI